MIASPNNILLSNLIIIRWIAIIGQLITILVVFFYLNISIKLVPCLIIVFTSLLVNFFSFFLNKKKNYLSDKEAFYFLLFDTLQLGCLLYLTGGIYNPFSLLLIAPLIITSSYLPIVYSIGLLILSIILVLAISFFYFPLIWHTIFEVPIYFSIGLSLSLIISLIFIFIYVYLFANSSRRISEDLIRTRSALANQKKISDIGSLSAAAVHELSTPLNTIFLILNDLREEKILQNNPDLNKEIDLLKSEADRCRKILLTLSKNPEKLKDNFFDKTTISNLVKINFDKFNNKKLKLKIRYSSSDEEPKVLYKEEIVYGIGNIIQNAVEYAKEKVEIYILWNEKEFRIIIEDDGPGFENEIFNELASPYIVNKKFGMGLGIHIAKNLIESIGGSLSIKNKIGNGASVEIIIKRDS